MDTRTLVKRIQQQAGPFNGVGIHSFGDQVMTGDDQNTVAARDMWIGRMAETGATAVTTLNRDYATLRRFHDFGFNLVLCRPFRRWYQPWTNDGDPVQNMVRAGLVPIIQANNEDELTEEGDGQPFNMMVAGPNLLSASIQIHNQGGVVAWQMVSYEFFDYCYELAHSPQWNCAEIFDDFVFVPHPYGLNNPSWYNRDDSSFIGGVKLWSQHIQQIMGHKVPLIAGEMGWAVGSSDNNTMPVVTPELMAQYAREAFSSFKTGKFPDGSDLCDELLAAMWWLIGAKILHLDSRHENAAIYKEDGSRQDILIDAIKSIGPFVRRFTWDDAPDPIDPPDEEEEPMPEELGHAFKQLVDVNPGIDYGTPTGKQIDMYPDGELSLHMTDRGIFFYQYGKAIFVKADASFPKI